MTEQINESYVERQEREKKESANAGENLRLTTGLAKLNTEKQRIIDDGGGEDNLTQQNKNRITLIDQEIKIAEARQKEIKPEVEAVRERSRRAGLTDRERITEDTEKEEAKEKEEAEEAEEDKGDEFSKNEIEVEKARRKEALLAAKEKIDSDLAEIDGE